MDKQGKNERVSSSYYSDFLKRRLIVPHLNIGVSRKVGGWLGG